MEILENQSIGYLILVARSGGDATEKKPCKQ